MILLTATTDSIEVITAQAVTVDVHVSWIDYAAGVTTPGRTNAAISTATTTVNLPAAPATSTQRNVKTINIRNKHATTAVTVTVQFNQNGTLIELYKVTLNAGEVLQYIDTDGWRVLGATQYPILMKLLTADDTGGANSANAQPWFPTAGGVTVAALTSYVFDGQLMLATGATTHTTGTLFAGTATLTSIDYYAEIFSTANLTIGTAISVIRVSVATVIVLNGTSTAVETVIRLRGIVRINAAGTFIPQFKFSADPTGTITVRRNSYFRMQALPGDNTLANIGAWA